MDVQIKTDRMVRKESVLRAVRRNLRQAFGAFPEAVKAVSVSVTDDASNSQRLCCQLEVRLDGHVAVVVRQTNAGSVEAVDRAFERARKTIRAKFRRGQRADLHALNHGKPAARRESNDAKRRLTLKRRAKASTPSAETGAASTGLAA